MRLLAIQYLPSRYPDAVPGQATPSEAFSPSQSAAAVATAELMVSQSAATWHELLVAAQEGDDEDER